MVDWTNAPLLDPMPCLACPDTMKNLAWVTSGQPARLPVSAWATDVLCSDIQEGNPCWSCTHTEQGHCSSSFRGHSCFSPLLADTFPAFQTGKYWEDGKQLTLQEFKELPELVPSDALEMWVEQGCKTKKPNLSLLYFSFRFHTV